MSLYGIARISVVALSSVVFTQRNETQSIWFKLSDNTDANSLLQVNLKLQCLLCCEW
jgi:hypothetical protein